MTVRDSAGAKGMEREGGRVGWGCRSGVHDRVWVEFHTWRSARSGVGQEAEKGFMNPEQVL